jgi:predicted amidophosphoribosyltransferase
MADAADRAQMDDDTIAKYLQTDYELPSGIAGNCEQCGEFSPRIVNNLCAPCRDKLDKFAQRTGRR